MSMAYTLHNRLGSGGFAVEAVLALAGAEYRYIPIESVPSTPLGEKITHINPWGQVPALETPDGKVVTETAAILIHLADAEASVRDGPHLWNPDPPAFLRWTVFMAVNIYEGILRGTYPDRYFDAALIDGDPDAVVASVRAAAKQRNHDAFTMIERAVDQGGFILGTQMSACDVFLAMLYAWHRKKPDLPKCTEITERVACHRVVNPIWEKNFDARLEEKWHRARPLWE